jgi:mono/diheme cytochrome c family protein
MSSSRYAKFSFVGFALLTFACASEGDIQRPHMGAISGAGADEGDDSNKSESEGLNQEADAGTAEVDAGASETPDAGSSEVPDASSDGADAAVTADAGESEGTGLPCEVEALLKMHCQGCHGPQAKNGVPLTTFAQLSAASKGYPDETIAERALTRMSSSERPMPPTGKGTPVSADEAAAFAAWIDHGAALEQCEE